MKIIAPSYYPSFKCIANKCKHSCCIGWEIDIDEDTYRYYQTIDSDFGKKLIKNIEIEDDVAHFILNKEDRCPFLNDDGLCDIINTIGENGLCQICDDHPRYRNFYSDRTEIGLGLCCEAVAEIIISFKDKVELITIDNDNITQEICQYEQDFLIFRQKIFNILQDRNISMNNRIDKMLLLCQTKMPEKSIKEWVDIFIKLERLDEKWTEIMNLLKDCEFVFEEFYQPDWDIILEQIAVYLVYRHFTDSLDDGRLKERAIFVAVSCHIIKHIFMMYNAKNKNLTIENMADIVRMYSSEIEYSVSNIETLLELT